jgi:exodeoxyribonuclease V alpha subunit
MQGGLKVYRGAAGAARHYVEADHSRVDDYYLAEGTGLAERFTASPNAGVVPVGALDGDGYEAWVAGLDPDTGGPRGRLRTDANAVRFVEVVVNGPKSWSLAAALNPEVAEAYDAAMDRAANQIIGWLAEHATTRVGPRGRQVQVPVEGLEAVTVRHYTSRAGDPHRHLHLQVNARVYAAGTWRGLHTVGVRDSLSAINGIGHAAMMTDPQFRATLARHGFTLDPATGELRELTRFVGAFSARARQIAGNVDHYEAQWRQAHPGQEPGPSLRRGWDARAWAQARPDKVAPTSGLELVDRWNQELHDLGYPDPNPPPAAVSPPSQGPRPGALDREQAVQVVLTRLGARRSAWNRADIRGEVERWVAATGLVTDAVVRIELAEDLTDRVTHACVPLLSQSRVPEHIRALSSPEVLAVEADLVTRLARRAESDVPVLPPDTSRLMDLGLDTAGLDAAQADTVTLLAGSGPLLVVEGAAGSGKTRTLAATSAALSVQGHRIVVVTPTMKAARVARQETGVTAFSAAWLAHQHGWRWDDDGRWTRVAGQPDPGAVLRRGDLLVVDEAGMLDQDTARALLTLADDACARVALLGDRHQLPAVGRGGVLDLATRWAIPESRGCLDVVHRFEDPEYAALTLAMRNGGEAVGEVLGEAPHGTSEIFDALVTRGQIRLHANDAERTAALADAATTALASQRGALVMADTHEQVAALNQAIRDRLVGAGRVDDTGVVTTHDGQRLGVGDQVTTRRNDRDLGVANRDTWTITGIGDDGSLTITGSTPASSRTLPAAYAAKYVELAYATTVYGAQGETTHTGHLILGEHTTGSAAYVGMTRGRHDNIAHLVADDLQQARALWEAAFRRDPADLGPAHAAREAAKDAERYGPLRPLGPALQQLRGAWTTEADLHDTIGRTQKRRDAVAAEGAPAADWLAQIDAELTGLTDQLHAARRQVSAGLREPAIRDLAPDRLDVERTRWSRDREERQAALVAAWHKSQMRPATDHHQPPTYSVRADRGRGIGR